MILDQLFKLMSEKSASDLYFSAGTPIHIKINGNSVPINKTNMDPPTIRRMAYEVMSEEQQKTYEETLEMNLSVSRRDVGNFRINIFRQRNSPAMVIRYIASNVPELSSLHLPAVLADLVMEKRGLILMVGATGSGKSTSLAAMIDHRNASRSGHILTLEDPVEFLFKHKRSIVNQREVGLDTRSFQDALKNALRQAPDVILIGEIRDRDTMTMGLQYAQSGHLCLATLHANNSYHAMNRINTFYPLENRPTLLLDLSASLKAIVSQRLVKNKEGGRSPAVEVLLNTRHISELIEKGEINEIKEAMEKSLSPGSQTFEQDLFRMYRSGEITLEEALSNSDSPTNLSWLINNSEAEKEAAAAAPEKAEKEAKAEQDFTGTGQVPSFSDFNLNMDETEKQDAA
jgi:twitching motility protein PilU